MRDGKYYYIYISLVYGTLYFVNIIYTVLFLECVDQKSTSWTLGIKNPSIIEATEAWAKVLCPDSCIAKNHMSSQPSNDQKRIQIQLIICNTPPKNSPVRKKCWLEDDVFLLKWSLFTLTFLHFRGGKKLPSLPELLGSTLNLCTGLVFFARLAGSFLLLESYRDLKSIKS